MIFAARNSSSLVCTRTTCRNERQKEKAENPFVARHHHRTNLFIRCHEGRGPVMSRLGLIDASEGVLCGVSTEVWGPHADSRRLGSSHHMYIRFLCLPDLVTFYFLPAFPLSISCSTSQPLFPTGNINSPTTKCRSRHGSQRRSGYGSLSYREE